MRPGLTAACSTTWQWWVWSSLKTVRNRSTDPFVAWRMSQTQMSWVVQQIADAFALPLRMTSFLWKWEVSCITWVSRELSKFSGLTTTSQTACVEGLLTRCIEMIFKASVYIATSALTFYSLFSANRTIFLRQRFLSGPTTGWWSGCALWILLNTLPIWEAVVFMEDWWWSPAVLSHPEGCFPLELSTSDTLSLLRFWSHGSMWRPWLYCWTFLPTRRCCAATSPLISPCWLAQRPSSTSRTVLKTQTTRCSLLPLKWR